VKSAPHVAVAQQVFSARLLTDLESAVGARTRVRMRTDCREHKIRAPARPPPPAPAVEEGSREAFPVIDLSAWTSEEDGKREEWFPASLRALESSNQVSVSLQAHGVRG
jgi:hypothetical protein